MTLRPQLPDGRAVDLGEGADLIISHCGPTRRIVRQQQDRLPQIKATMTTKT
jgi:hypothetical protein